MRRLSGFYLWRGCLVPCQREVTTLYDLDYPFVMLLMAGLSTLCWRLGSGKVVREFFVAKRSLVIFYEIVFLVAFAAFIFIRMLNPDLWHPSLGGEKMMEFGFLNSTLRSAWMPPADPFFANGYINYYYYGQFVMAVMIKLLGVYPALGVNLSIPLLYAFTFTAGASIVYNIVAWAQHRRGSLHTVSGAGMVFGFLSGFLMLVTGNMHGPFQWIMINNPSFANTLIGWARDLHFTEQSMLNPVSTFDFWGPSRIVAHTINEFPFWSFLFADFHPHLIDMPFTLVAKFRGQPGLCGTVPVRGTAGHAHPHTGQGVARMALGDRVGRARSSSVCWQLCWVRCSPRTRGTGPRSPVLPEAGCWLRCLWRRSGNPSLRSWVT